jgi:hypothetical protein
MGRYSLISLMRYFIPTGLVCLVGVFLPIFCPDGTQDKTRECSFVAKWLLSKNFINKSSSSKL